jgi:hypothetical protein
MRKPRRRAYDSLATGGNMSGWRGDGGSRPAPPPYPRG